MVRQSTFLGLREDKRAEEIVRDPKGPGQSAEASSAPQKKPLPRIERDGSTLVAGIRISNAEKVYWPDNGMTKLDLARYDAEVAAHALPHLGNRPLSLVRCPEGIAGEHFFQKHHSRGMPAAIHHMPVAEKGQTKTALFITDVGGLVALAQFGVLEIHPWGSTVAAVETPDRLTFDLDPDEGLPWEQVVEAALAMRAELTALGLESFVKTTGGKGLHVVVPIAPKLGWDDAKAFTKAVAQAMVDEAPQRFTANLAKRARHGRVFIDYLRNGRGATAVGAFSTRARPGATVAAPLSWAELESGARPDRFTIATMPQRLAEQRSDPWDGFLTLKQTIGAKARRRLQL